MMNAGAVALALACTVAIFDTQPAQAGTLFDFFRSNRAGARPQQQQVMVPQEETVGIPRAEATPLPKVTGPRYYTYKAEALRLVASGTFADPVVTGAVDGTTATPAVTDPLVEQRRFLSQAQVRATPDVAKALEAYYGGNNPLVWVTDTGINDKARAALAVLAAADAVGLDARDYAVAVPADAADGVDPALRNRELTQFELALSGKVLAYVQDTGRGRIDPNKISGYHDFKRKTVDLGSVLTRSRAATNVQTYLESRNPWGTEFQTLKAELAKLRAEQSADEHVVINLEGILKPGGSSPEMMNIVAAIQKHGSDALKVDHSLTLTSYTQTPEYTPELVALVEAFQQEHGLKPDGVIGKATVRAMVGDSPDEKIKKLVVAMEQVRWLPDTLGARYVFINQPAYRVYYHNNNKEELSMRVVVGSPTHQTFFFEDQIETVEFNPYWGVPQSIIINEMLPKLRADPNYLDRMGYQVEVGGRKVASSSVDWYSSTNSVAVRQPPSSDNALGELKILFPNAHAIYMHDTPSKSFFKKDIRALSHGCVRLAEPRVMAAAVLGTTVEDVAKQIDAGQNRAVSVPVKIPVYVSYFTAWPNKDGVVEYFDDVYSRDSYMSKAFDATSKARDAQS